MGWSASTRAGSIFSTFTRSTLPPDEPISFLTLFRIQLSTKAVGNLVPGGSAAGSPQG